MKTLLYKVAASALMLTTTIAATAQTDNTFSIMTLNVDGLPARLLFFDVNKDGPASAGSKLISKYIASKDCDIVAMQENFNYRWEIWSRLFYAYNHDEWSGGVSLVDNKIDYAHLHNNRFPCDGLNMAWKKKCQSASMERVAWNRNFGKFSHEFDDMITKGFRRHEMTLAGGTEVVVYNMHMDASSKRDEQAGNDQKDRAARLSQWEQLRDHIMLHLDQRPVLVVGDMNSLYHRDDVKGVFIDAINQTNRAVVGDAWVELQCNGAYPTLNSETAVGEVLDKVLYINPANAEVTITPTKVVLDTAGYQNEGKPLGDHDPLIVTFAINDRGITGERDVTGIASASAEKHKQDGPAYTLKGTAATGKGQGIIIRNGKKRL